MLEAIFGLLSPIMGYLKNDSFPDVLSKEEEEEYIKQMANGDMEARNKLIIHNLRLVAHIIKKYDNTKEDKEDLLSIGTIGLVKGVDTFNPASNTKMSTYIARCIENEILMHLRSIKQKCNDLWLYSPVGEDKEGNEILLIDIIEDKSDALEDKIIDNEAKEKMLNNLYVLTEREFFIIKHRFGLGKTQILTQKEIAKELKISRSYVSRIEKRALLKLFFKISQK